MDINFYYYSKFVSLTNEEASLLVDKIICLSNNCINPDIIVCELGSGWGNISVPVIYNLEKQYKKINKSVYWYGLEKDQNKISYYEKFYELYKNDKDRNAYNGCIKELREGNNCKRLKSFVNEVNKQTPPSVGKKIIQFDLEVTDNLSTQINKLTNGQNIDLLFVPFIFQHLKNWRRIFKILLKLANNQLIVVAGELEGDWETCFSPYKVSAYNEWRTFFQKIWKDYTIIPTSLRDYKHYNLSVFSAFIENEKFNIKNFSECPLELKIETSERELIHHINNQVWSPFIQNITSIKKPKFRAKDFLEETKTFNSIHNIHIYHLEKK